MKKIAVIVGAVVVLAGIGVGVWLFLAPAEETGEMAEGTAAPVEDDREPIFFDLDPPFVVNFTHRGDLHYLQTTFSVQHPDQDVIDKVQLHLPAIRNDLIVLLSEQEFDVLNTREAKESLRLSIAETVTNRVSGGNGLQEPLEAYITSYVMQ